MENKYILKKIETYIKEQIRYTRAKLKLKKSNVVLGLRICYEAFDPNYYLVCYPELGIKKKDAFIHFMEQGWKKGLNPSPSFNTQYYLQCYPEVAASKENPFVHWIHNNPELHKTSSIVPELLHDTDYTPLVTVIIPNYNHAQYLPERIESVLNQSYQNFELLILDDVSSDNSREVIQAYADQHPDKIKTLLNDQNSGNVFKQWQKGIAEAKGDLIWICESDDFCESNFLGHLIPFFNDQSVNLAFGRIQFANHDGSVLLGADGYREHAEPGIWECTQIRPAAKWFQNGFGINNIIPNVGGCIFRNAPIRKEVWEKATTFSILGDWYLYLELAGAGQIVFEPLAVAYFRQHEDNTSVVAFKKKSFYEEHHTFMVELCSKWKIPTETINRFTKGVKQLYKNHECESKFGAFETIFNQNSLHTTLQASPHINIAFLGYSVGGGELFPINIANQFQNMGYTVSMTLFDSQRRAPEMVNALQVGIPVYHCQTIARDYDNFISNTGIDIIHSHMVCLDVFFMEQFSKPDCLYVVSLHGSYEACLIEEKRMDLFYNNVDLFLYTADRNLSYFAPREITKDKFIKIANAMPYDERPFPMSRTELGIEEDTIVYTLVARGVKRKGWRASIQAFKELQKTHPKAKVHLLLCGDGESVAPLKELHDQDPSITFLGYQSCIHGLYRLSNVALLPSRFEGESYPLCLIQAIQCGLPIIGTDVGEIPHIITELRVGLCISAKRNTTEFAKDLCAAMSSLLEASRRSEFASNSLAAKDHFNMKSLSNRYMNIYKDQLMVNRD